MDTDEDDDRDRSLESVLLEKEVAAVSHRIILHFDLDCFYAQVEMIRNPALRNKPLGVQQKYIIVTCNYVARERGVTKLMSVAAALEKCPELVLVNGEDLTHYRETSYKVTELLMSYCPVVERLGFDENFLDATEMVERRLEQSRVSDLSFTGHVYQHNFVAVDAGNVRLAVGSVIAAELRLAIFNTLALTGCAGIASSKLLAKLVSGTFKPNQQTSLLPSSSTQLISGLAGLRQIPGIGHRTGEKLKALGLLTVSDVQLCALAELQKEFGEVNGRRIWNLAHGIDDSPVTPAGPPQTLSDEDSFKKISSLPEVTKKIYELLTSLTERMYKDGRQPQTFRLSIRRHSTHTRWMNRESRQCPVPQHTGLKITAGSSEAVPQLLSIAMKLFPKMVDTREPFHLTLLNVSFSHLQARSSHSSSILSFFTQKSPATPASARQMESDSSDCVASSASCDSVAQTLTATASENVCPTEESSSGQGSACVRLPSSVDPEVFRQLPEHIQTEVISSFQSEATDGTLSPSGSVLMESCGDPELQTSTPHVPPGVDLCVFSQLPADVRKDLMTQWKQQTPVLKVPSRLLQKARARNPKGRSQGNSILKYFKPS